MYALQDDVALEQEWSVSGMHYSRTLEDWLVRQDRRQGEVLPIFAVRTPPKPRLDPYCISLPDVDLPLSLSLSLSLEPLLPDP
jgi:hypothetical protein